MNDFTSGVAVVTGAASGIGKALAEKCASEGMKVVLADIEEARLLSVEKSLKSHGADVLAVKTDVRNYTDVEVLARKTLDTFGAVHLLFNNAGVAPGGPAWEVDLKDWEWILGVNLRGVIHGIKAFVPVMLEQGTRCHIVNTASVAGLIAAGVYDAPYRTTKHAIVSLTEALYSDLKMKKADIGVSVVCPGEVHSDLWDYERNRPPELSHSGITRARPEENRLNEMSAETCADIVFEGIRADKLYILTHPQFNGYFRRRADDILSGNNPLVPGDEGF